MRLGGFHENASALLLWYQSEHNRLKLYSRKCPPHRIHLTDVGQAVSKVIPGRLVPRSKLALNGNPVAAAQWRGTQ